MGKTPWYKKEFPLYDAELYIPNGWEDNSWHNNACPHAEKSQGMYTACIMQDYINPNYRQFSFTDDGERYLCQVFCDDTNLVYEVITNDLEVVKKFVEEVEQRYFS